MLKTGKLVVVDGIDGCGKSTVAKYIADTIGGKIITFLGEGPIGKEVRKLVLTKETNLPNEVTAGLIGAATTESFYVYILPALQAGINVVLDRYLCSSYVYQVYSCYDVGYYPEFRRISTRMLSLAPPDLSIWLDVSLKVSKERLSDRSDLNHYDTAGDTFKKTLIAGYKEAHHTGLLPSSAVINADKPLIDVFTTVDDLLNIYDIL